MSIIRRDSDELEDKLESLRIEGQVLEESARNEQRKAIIKQLKKKYGKNWRNMLKLKDNESMRQFSNMGRRMSQLTPHDEDFTMR